MAVRVGSARIDENGHISGGRAGDQTGKEVSTQNWYLHNKGWYVLRPTSATAAEKIAKCMQMACDNPNIGYNQADNKSLYKAAEPYGFDVSKVTKPCNVDCARLVRVCVKYAGIDCDDFYTGNEVSVLLATGKFKLLKSAIYTKSSNYLKRGDILVTQTKGHTVVVLDNGANVVTSKKGVYTGEFPTLPLHKDGYRYLESGNSGSQVTKLQKFLNWYGGYELKIDGVFGAKTKSAVKKFQKANKLVVDGVFGVKSLAKAKTIRK